MIEFDPSQLRAQVIQDFESFERRTTDAEALEDFADTVVTDAIATVRSMLHEVNKDSFMGRIPAKILAICFAHLPHLFRMPVSQVCRHWRTAVLSAPELWSDIAPRTPGIIPDPFHMVLSRPENRPVDMKVDSRAGLHPQAMYDAIVPFSRLLRYVAWHGKQPVSPWVFPAPNMECFWSSTAMAIDAAFLGGQPGKLRHLYLDCVYLPAMCPALSTVSELSLALTGFQDELPSTLRNLFDLLPRLEFLNIRGITAPAAGCLPSGPAPPSLKELWLQSRSLEYDLTPHYLSWDSGNLQHVSLSQYSGVHPNLEHMVCGAVRLAVRHVTGQPDTCLMFEHSAATTRSITVRQLAIIDAAALLAAVQPQLSDIHTAMLSHNALGPLVGLLGGLPNLEHLFLHIVPQNERGSYPPPRPHTFTWAHLFWLPVIADTARALRAITLHVWCGEYRGSSFANAQHALELISCLRAMPKDHPPIEIQGFAADQVDSLDLSGLNIRFNVSAKVGGLVLHERREAYDPFRVQMDWDL